MGPHGLIDSCELDSLQPRAWTPTHHGFVHLMITWVSFVYPYFDRADAVANRAVYWRDAGLKAPYRHH